MKKTYTISGMSCQHCVMAVKKELAKLENLDAAEVRIGAADVEYDPTRVDEAAIRAAIIEAGYAVVE
ncbi:MAG: heavy-metal-associated domain-containing protein [Ignavibacteriae bacterium]|nr:heavy-metal-associated domain-containing protein [Ignavibacteriota bacterium]